MTATASFHFVQQPTALVVSRQPPRAAKLAESAAIAGWAAIVCSDTDQAIAILEQQSRLEISAVLLDDAGIVEPVRRIVGHIKRRNSNSLIIVTDTCRYHEWNLEENESEKIHHCANLMEVQSIARRLQNLAHYKRLNAGIPNETRYGATAFSFSSLLGEDSTFQAAISLAKKIAGENRSVTLEGELGTGRRTLARAIHYASAREGLPIKTLSVGGKSQAALELSLFGHERGAFVGAFETQPGMLQQCHHGTLIVVGIDLLPQTVQDRLADALSEKRVRPFGSSVLVDADVRLLALSERPLGELAQQGFYSERLLDNAVRILIPSLSERRSDIGLIAKHFTRLFGTILGVPDLAIDDAAIEALTACEWQGNVRKLQAVLCHAAAFAQSDAITVDDLAKAMCKGRVDAEVANQAISTLLDEGVPLRGKDGNLRSLTDIEDHVIEMAMKAYGGSMTKVASSLGIGRSTLYRKLANRASPAGARP